MEDVYGIKSLKSFVFIVIAAALGAAGATYATSYFFSSDDFSYAPLACNVLGIQVHGMVVGSKSDIPIIDILTTQDQMGGTILLYPNYTVANEIEDKIRYYKDDPNIKALLVDVQSGGGMAVGGVEIATSIRKFRKPSVSVIHDTGASSGYLAASAADTVFALSDSIVGSIGTTYSYVSNHEKNKKEGYTYEQLSSGPYKDMLDPNKPLTVAERALIMRDVKITRDNFVKLIAEYRGLPIEKINTLADGSAMLGTAALAERLIDHIGGSWDAIEHIEKIIGEPVSICWQ